MLQFFGYQPSLLKIALVETHLPGQCGIEMSTTDSMTAIPTEDAKVHLYFSESNMCPALSMARISEIPDWLGKCNQMELE